MAKKKPSTLCFCNNVSRDTVRASIQAGASTLAAIYDATGAGTGPCGGSCRASILKLVQESRSPESTQNVPDVPAYLVRAISLFNRRYYWECHEVLEHEWLRAQGPTKIFLQGLIQASAAFYHVLNANPMGTLKLAQESQNKLLGFPDEHLSLGLGPLRESLHSFEVQSKEILGKLRSGFDYDQLPQIPVLGA